MEDKNKEVGKQKDLFKKLKYIFFSFCYNIVAIARASVSNPRILLLIVLNKIEQQLL